MSNRKGILSLVIIACILVLGLLGDFGSVKNWGPIAGRRKYATTKNLRHGFIPNDKQQSMHQMSLFRNDDDNDEFSEEYNTHPQYWVSSNP